MVKQSSEWTISTPVTMTTPVCKFNKQSHTELIFTVYLLCQELPQVFFTCVANYIYEILIENLPKPSFVGITHPVTGKKKTIMVHLTKNLGDIWITKQSFHWPWREIYVYYGGGCVRVGKTGESPDAPKLRVWLLFLLGHRRIEQQKYLQNEQLNGQKLCQLVLLGFPCQKSVIPIKATFPHVKVVFCFFVFVFF